MTKNLAELEKENKELNQFLEVIYQTCQKSVAENHAIIQTGLSKSRWAYCQAKIDLAQDIIVLYDRPKKGIIRKLFDSLWRA